MLPKLWLKSSLLWLGRVFLRSLSMFDLFTDIRLLYLSSESSFLFLTMVLFLSIICPYLLSYSCGIKIFFIQGIYNKNNNMYGFYKFLSYLYLLPIGIMYFVFFDLFDYFFIIYQFIQVLLFNESTKYLIKLEELISIQIGIGNKMNYEGIKRQKTVGQLMFETIPQLIVNIILVFF